MPVVEKVEEDLAVEGREKDLANGEERCTGETDETCLRAIMQKMMQEEARIYFDGFKGIHLLTQLNYRK
jgi:hypothetical protein